MIRVLRFDDQRTESPTTVYYAATIKPRIAFEQLRYDIISNTNAASATVRGLLYDTKRASSSKYYCCGHKLASKMILWAIVDTVRVKATTVHKFDFSVF